jgi:diphosphomevalonate decarboxylase
MRASAIAHPNIALIKYWGKRDSAANLPAVGSLSVTLSALSTETTIEFDSRLSEDVLILNGQAHPAEQARLSACLDALRRLAGERLHASVSSRNDFPTGAGLASSASGYAALVTAAGAALGIEDADARLLDIARIGSGSAPRSMFGGFVLMQNTNNGTRCEQILAPDDWPLEIVVAVTTEESKDVTSRDGMEQSRLTSPYYDAWTGTHAADLEQARTLIRERNFSALAELAEHNCLKMHSVMLTTRPALIYWSPTTLACMHRVADMRRQGVPVFFTVDAGPQVKAICLPEATEEVAAALQDVPGVMGVTAGGLGAGARLIDDAHIDAPDIDKIGSAR